MKVISCFDGISGAYQALKNLGVKVDQYFAFEIDKYAIQIAKKNHPDIVHLGSVREWKYTINKIVHPYCDFSTFLKNKPEIDLIIGGSPCQDLSIAGKQAGLKGERSGLFYEMAEMIKVLKPKYFFVENVASMKKCQRDIISKELGVDPIMINSALVTAQSRKRLYWTNISGIAQPEDKGIYLNDVLLSGWSEREKSYPLTATYHFAVPKDYFITKQRQLIFIEKSKGIIVHNIYGGFKEKKCRVFEDKSPTIRTSSGGGHIPSVFYGTKDEALSMPLEDLRKLVRKLYPIECERLQGFPDNYTEGISKTRQYGCLGNGFTVSVIEHILKGIK